MTKSAITAAAVITALVLGGVTTAMYLDTTRFDRVLFLVTPETSPQLMTFYFQLAQSQTVTALRYIGMLIASFITMLGAVFVALGYTAGYKLSLEGNNHKSLLETSSPGLVMITVGAALLGIIVFSPTKASLHLSNEPLLQTVPTTMSTAESSLRLDPFIKQNPVSKLVTEAEVSWARDLEEKSSQAGYVPTMQETKVYNDIVRRIKAAK